MRKIALLALSFAVVLSAFGLPSARAHEETQCGDFTIVGGWGIEPPLLNQLNSIELEVTRTSDGQPVANALAQMDISVRKGGESKPLDFAPQEEPGVYAAPILPTQTGQYAVAMQGTIAGQACNTQIEIEDVEGTDRVEFPPSSDGSSGPDPAIINQLREVISGLTSQVDAANVAAEEAQAAAQTATESAGELKSAADRAYLFGIVGVGVGVAGIIIGVVALSKRTSA